MTIRDHMAPEVGGLGPRKPRPDELVKPPQEKVIRPGIVEGLDGMLHTDLQIDPEAAKRPSDTPAAPPLGEPWPHKIEPRDKPTEDAS